MAAVMVLPGLVAATLVMLLGGALRAACSTAGLGGGRAAALRRLAATRETGDGAARRRPARLPAVPGWLARALAEAGIATDGSIVWSAWLASAVVLTASAVLVGGPALGGLTLALCTAAPLTLLRSRRGTGDTRAEAALPVALEAVARALRSGASLRQAVVEAGKATPPPLGPELARVATEAARGLPLVQALDGLAERRPLPGIRLAVAALSLGVETGGAQARAVDGVAATLRDRMAVASEVRALSAQARISALVIGVAPVGFGVFATATDPRTAEFLLRTPVGMALLVAGLTLDGLGWLWMWRLCRGPA